MLRDELSYATIRQVTIGATRFSHEARCLTAADRNYDRARSGIDGQACCNPLFLSHSYFAPDIRNGPRVFPPFLLIFLCRFRVEHGQSRIHLKDTFAGWACIRLDRLATGHRLIPLLDSDGGETMGLLFVKVQKSYRQ
jgi:hypothetical protein